MEIWKNIGDYRVSNFGKVYSYKSNKFLKQTEQTCGYLTYGSYLGSVHRLVVKTFLGEIPKGLVVNHIDGNKKNNYIGNLEITTYSDNLKHAFSLGLACNKGSLNSQAKLTERDILCMYKLFESGFNNNSVAGKFGLHDRYISLIRHGKRWKHVYDSYGKIFPKSFSYKYSPETLLYARTLILTGETNLRISEITGIEKSSVSRMRNKDLYKDFFQTWDRYSIATTKEKVGEEKYFTED